MAAARKNIYKTIMRGKERERQRSEKLFKRSKKREKLRRWQPMVLFGAALLVFLTCFVFRKAEAVYINGKNVAYVRDRENYDLAIELLECDLREDLGRELKIPEDISLREAYVPRFSIREPEASKAAFMNACGESYTYRYVYYVGGEMLGAVEAKDRKATEKVIGDHKKSLAGAYSWAENVEVIGDVWNSFRLAEEENYVTPEEIGAILNEKREIFTVRYEYEETVVESIPCEAEATLTRELLENETEVITPGKDGVETVVRRITAEDDREIHIEVLSRDVISEPEKAVVLQGNRKDTGYYFYAPVDSVKISSEFGYRILRGKRNYHSGVDYKVKEGTNVYAAAAGVVTKAGVFGNGDYGKAVVIDHGDGFVTYYAHNSQLLVEVGDTVKKGTLIALSGDTGNSTGPHCHFEVRLDGVQVDPFDYMERPEPDE